MQASTSSDADLAAKRSLLDAVLGGESALIERRSVPEMAIAGHVSASQLSRVLSRVAGESPAAMRRRVLLERAAWQVAHGEPVTTAAWMADFESVEGFSRAFNRAYGHPPSQADGGGHWLPAANGIHFHPPTSLYVESKEKPLNLLSELLVDHDLDDTRGLIEVASELPDAEWDAQRWAGHTVLEDGPEESIGAVLQHLVSTRAVWMAAIEGTQLPEPSQDRHRLLERHIELASRWTRMVRSIDARGGWEDVIIDTLCVPPESFPLRGIIAHVLTFSAYRRQVARRMLADAGLQVDTGDPIMWMRAEWSRS